MPWKVVQSPQQSAGKIQGSPVPRQVGGDAHSPPLHFLPLPQSVRSGRETALQTPSGLQACVVQALPSSQSTAEQQLVLGMHFLPHFRVPPLHVFLFLCFFLRFLASLSARPIRRANPPNQARSGNG